MVFYITQENFKSVGFAEVGQGIVKETLKFFNVVACG